MFRSRVSDDRPATTGLRGWVRVLRRAGEGYRSDGLGDWAAVLTYYAILSISPAMLVTASLLGLFGGDAIRPLLATLDGVAPGVARRFLEATLRELQSGGGQAGVAFALGAAVALWGASRYVAAFMRAGNGVYEMPEGRPLWRTVPLRLLLTVVLLALVAAGAFGLVLTGNLATMVGRALGFGETTVLAWQVLKWPLIVVIAGLVLAILYWAAPNVRHPGFRWVTPGSVLAVLIWLAASAGFGVYAATFGGYTRTYGALAGAVVVVIWLWVSNVAVLLGLELDAELERAHAISQGHDPDRGPFVAPRDPPDAAAVPHPRQHQS
ncbi:MAG: YihY family inner membrane protein [Streptosporangiales bacterium]|nr:YihY family inner membrane protein [Streptosporangiales bacterium]